MGLRSSLMARSNLAGRAYIVDFPPGNLSVANFQRTSTTAMVNSKTRRLLLKASKKGVPSVNVHGGRTAGSASPGIPIAPFGRLTAVFGDGRLRVVELVAGDCALAVGQIPASGFEDKSPHSERSGSPTRRMRKTIGFPLSTILEKCSIESDASKCSGDDGV